MDKTKAKTRQPLPTEPSTPNANESDSAAKRTARRKRRAKSRASWAAPKHNDTPPNKRRKNRARLQRLVFTDSESETDESPRATGTVWSVMDHQSSGDEIPDHVWLRDKTLCTCGCQSTTDINI